MKTVRTKHARWVSTIVVCSLCLTVFPSLAAFAQQTGAAPPVRSSSSHNLIINVVVTDKNGKPVPGLQESDFTVLDNKRPDKIISFQAVGGPAADDPPPKIVLLVDDVNVSFNTMAYERPLLEKAVSMEGGLPYPVELDFFSDPGTITPVPPTRDPKTLIATIDQKVTALRTLNRTGQWAGEQLMDMSLNALQAFLGHEDAEPGRKILIWVAPGWPFPIGPTYLDSKQEQDLFRTVVGFTTDLQQSATTLYMVDPLGSANPVEATTAFETFLDPPRKPTQAQPGDLALQVFAEHSGGLVLHSNNDLAAEIDKCIADTDAYYTVTFEAPAADGPNDYHSLQVKIDKPKLNARTTTGYYGQP